MPYFEGEQRFLYESAANTMCDDIARVASMVDEMFGALSERQRYVYHSVPEEAQFSVADLMAESVPELNGVRTNELGRWLFEVIGRGAWYFAALQATRDVSFVPAQGLTISGERQAEQFPNILNLYDRQVVTRILAVRAPGAVIHQQPSCAAIALGEGLRTLVGYNSPVREQARRMMYTAPLTRVGRVGADVFSVETETTTTNVPRNVYLGFQGHSADGVALPELGVVIGNGVFDDGLRGVVRLTQMNQYGSITPVQQRLELPLYDADEWQVGITTVKQHMNTLGQVLTGRVGPHVLGSPANE